MTKRRVCRVLLLGALVGVMALTARPATAQTISVEVTQILASSKGNYVDPTLGPLGEMLRKKYPAYRSYRMAGSSSQAGQVGQTLQFVLNGGMVLTLDLLAYEDPWVSMRATVPRLVRTDLRLKKGRSVLISVPLGADALVLIIAPTVK